MNNCLSCRWEPEWSPADSLRSMIDGDRYTGHCKKPIPQCYYGQKILIVKLDGKVQYNTCPAWEPKE